MLTTDMTVRNKAHELCLKVFRLRKTMMLRIPPSMPAMSMGKPTPMTTLFKSSKALELDGDIAKGWVLPSEMSDAGYVYRGECTSAFSETYVTVNIFNHCRNLINQ